ncbi:MAG TPA: glycosyltransferase family 39 protein [Solirubrobacteraceae bacterium]|jgi:4-amino-4-deoxy-L-arabinose transferase-like glycosyltransferase|nr:glycosyltransferase family 39 protein [Solirubrobacteraceae bacterium]
MIAQSSQRTAAIDRDRDATRAHIWLLVLSLVALVFRLTSISRSMFNDETVSLALAQRSFGHMFSLYGYEANGTPYSLLLWPIVRIFGTHEAILRLPAVIAGTLSVPAMYWAARGFRLSRAAALLAAALLAINPMAVWYSQTARSYAFVVLAACATFGGLVRLVDDPDRGRDWWVFVAGMVLMGYSDLFAPFLALPAQLLIVRRAPRASVRRWITALAAALVAGIPLIIAALISHGRRDALYWLPKLDRGLVELALQEFSGGFSGVTAVRWLTLLGLVVLVGAAIVLAALRRAPSASGERAGTLAVAVTWGVLPAALLLVISKVEPAFWPRYAIVALPGLCLLAAVAAERVVSLGRAPVALGCVALIAAASLYADVEQRGVVQQEWRPTIHWLASNRNAREWVIVDNVLMLPSIGYYDPSLKAPNGELIVQEWHDTPLPKRFVGYKDPTGYGRALNGPPSLALVRRVAAEGGGSIWFVFGEIDSLEQGTTSQMAVVKWARSNCHVQTRASTGVEVMHATACRG